VGNGVRGQQIILRNKRVGRKRTSYDKIPRGELKKTRGDITK